LHPIQFDEPFGLSVIESMACGTPVIAFDRGSMPELIENGKNGFLVEQRGRGR
jgi:glycosyltransferase involved in cell wall biosynthesis